MKNLILFLIFNTATLAYAQFPNKDELLKSLDIRKVIITASEFDKGKEIKRKVHLEEFDELGNKISFNSYDNEGKAISFTIYNYLDNGLKVIKNEYKGDSSLIYSYVNTIDTINKIKSNIQIASNGDTLVYQIRYLNRLGLDSILFTRTKDSPQFKVTARWDYDSSGNLLSSKIMNFKKVKDSNCEITYDVNDIIISKTCLFNNKEIMYFYKDKVGYLYGITLYSKAGGQRVTTSNNVGLVSDISYLDKKGRLISKIVFEYKR